MVTIQAWLRIAVAALVLLTAAAAQAQAPERRFALIIGNDEYRTAAKLATPANDARLLERKLKALGFETSLRVNAGRRDMTRALAEFGDKIGGGAVGLFFYAGYGVQLGDRNFLLPSDAHVEDETDLVAEAIDVTNVLRTMEDARNPVNVLILDAARDNPLTKRTRSAARGLAQGAAPRGTFIAFSASPGERAEDSGANGVFTAELAQVLDVPALTIEDVFKRVTAAVAAKTNGRQTPWTQASLAGNFYLNTGAPAAAPAPAAAAAPPAAVGPDRETVFWQSIQGGTNAAELEAYLQQFPNGTYAPLARARLTQLKGPQTAALPPATAPAPAPAPAQPAPPPVVAPAPAVPPAPVAAPASPITVPPSTEPAAGAYVASIAANVREQASTQSPVVGRLAAGQSVQVAGKSNGWYLVQQDGKPLGYVAANLLEDEAAWRQRQGTPPPQQQAAVAAPAPPAPASPAQPAVGLYLDRPGQVFRDCAECPEMVVIPGGTFMMGSPNSETGRYGDEGPVHRVTVPSFAAGKYEVTRGEFGAFARATNFRPSGGCYQWTGQKFDLDSGKSWSNPGFAQTDRDPVVCVNWDDTQRYIAWLREKSGKPYRLLSEAEWEYAARAGTTSAQVWGDRVQDACGLANLADAAARRTGPANWTYLACNDGFANTAPVGSFKPNAFGLHDMIGNAWEWVADCLNERYDGAPTDGRVWQAGDCTKHMLRGASWFFQPRVERFAARGWAEADSRDYFQGFRVARPN